MNGFPLEEEIEKISSVNWGRRVRVGGWEHEGSGWVGWGQDRGGE